MTASRNAPDGAERTAEVTRASDTYSSAIADATNYIEWIISTFRPYLKGDILEIGLGHGSYVNVLEKLGRYHGLDIDPEAVETARRRDPSLRYAVVDIAAEDVSGAFGGTRFDAIFCSNVIEHIQADEAAIRGLVRALKPGGHLLVLTPALPQLYNDLDRLAGHVRRYTRADAVRLASAADARLEQVAYFNPIGGLGWWANRFKSHASLNDPAVNAQIRFFDRYILPFSRLLDPLTRNIFGQSIVLVLSPLSRTHA